MSNQVIILLMFIVPWLTLFFIKKQNLNRFISAGLFTAVTSGVIYQFGIMFRFWYFKEISFPLIMYGTLPVAAMWVLRFTYGRYWIYTLTNAILDFGFAFVLFPWFGRIEILGTGPWTGLIVYGINFIHAALVYGYQVWRDGTLRESKQ